MSGEHSDATKESLRPQRAIEPEGGTVLPRRWAFSTWLVQDSPYIAMLVLPLLGVIFRLPVDYWVILTPAFGVICIAAGWRRLEGREARLQLVYMQVLNWFAFLLAIYLLYSNGVQGVLSPIATSLMMLTLLALGTFVAGLEARVWRLCAVGGILFLAVPAIGWLKQSATLLVLATLVVIAISGLTWWVSQQRESAAL